MTPSRTFRPTGFVQIRLQSLSHGYSEFQEHFSLCNHNSTHTKHTILESCVLISMYINVQDYWGRVESKQQFWGWQDWPVHLSCEPWTALPPWHSRHYQDDPPLCNIFICYPYWLLFRTRWRSLVLSSVRWVVRVQVQVLGLGPGPRVSRAWYFRTFYVNDCTYRSLFYVEHYKKLACPVKLDCP